MPDKDIWAVKVGPLVVGGVEDRKPESPLFRLVAWCLVAVLVTASIHPFLGVVTIFVAAMIVVAKTAPADSERTQP
jgi:hypothetical protein